jgi:hypothetical protein
VTSAKKKKAIREMNDKTELMWMPTIATVYAMQKLLQGHR